MPRSSGSMSTPTCCGMPQGYALANEGTDTRLIQDFLGHASIANTVRYTRASAPRRFAVSGKMAPARCDRGHDLQLIQDYPGHRDPKHTVHYTRTACGRFEGLW